MNPQVGEIWRMSAPVVGAVQPMAPVRNITMRATHFLLLEGWQEYEYTFRMLCLETGQHIALYMNFDLDNWEKVE